MTCSQLCMHCIAHMPCCSCFETAPPSMAVFGIKRRGTERESRKSDAATEVAHMLQVQTAHSNKPKLCCLFPSLARSGSGPPHVNRAWPSLPCLPPGQPVGRPSAHRRSLSPHDTPQTSPRKITSLQSLQPTSRGQKRRGANTEVPREGHQRKGPRHPGETQRTKTLTLTPGPPPPSSRKPTNNPGETQRTGRSLSHPSSTHSCQQTG